VHTYRVRPHRDPSGRVQFLAMVADDEEIDPGQVIEVTTEVDLFAPVEDPDGGPRTPEE
jgi:hypothetical protein